MFLEGERLQKKKGLIPVDIVEVVNIGIMNANIHSRETEW